MLCWQRVRRATCCIAKTVSSIPITMALCWAAAVGAQVHTPQDQFVTNQEALVRLALIHDAPGKLNFTGTFVFSTAGGAMSSARMAHYCEGKDQFERIDSLDGPARQVLRHNQQVHTVWPQDRLVVFEQRDDYSAFPALLMRPDAQILHHYEVLTRGQERVAGHVANVIQLIPRDGYRYGYRLWSDSSSDLLLRADVLGQRNELLESSAFSDVTIGVKSQPRFVLDAIKKLGNYRFIPSRLNATTLDSHGWMMRAAVPGFRQLSCFTRPLHDSSHAGDAQAQTLQVVYSDGITYLSLFIEPFDGRRHENPSSSVFGATRTLSRRHADWWITAVGGVPAATLRAFAEGLERK
jgi:sigma-E factor negative regulatory protein RseB